MKSNWNRRVGALCLLLLSLVAANPAHTNALQFTGIHPVSIEPIYRRDYSPNSPLLNPPHVKI
jgi:hypothetical protein